MSDQMIFEASDGTIKTDSNHWLVFVVKRCGMLDVLHLCNIFAKLQENINNGRNRPWCTLTLVWPYSLYLVNRKIRSKTAPCEEWTWSSTTTIFRWKMEPLKSDFIAFFVQAQESINKTWSSRWPQLKLPTRCHCRGRSSRLLTRFPLSRYNRRKPYKKKKKKGVARFHPPNYCKLLQEV